VSQSSEFCRHNPLCCFSTSVYCCNRILRYRLSPESFGYTFVHKPPRKQFVNLQCLTETKLNHLLRIRNRRILYFMRLKQSIYIYIYIYIYIVTFFFVAPAEIFNPTKQRHSLNFRTDFFVIFLQGLGQRPVTVQKFKFWTYESIWTVGRTPWTGDQPDARPLATQDNTRQKKRGHTSMPRAGFEPAIPMFERPKTVRQNRFQ
jgi:hypothetical protein